MPTKAKKSIRYTQVFVPGGFPTFTYNPRDEHKLEQKIRSASDNLCKLMVVTGATKSGKTVLVDKIYQRSENVWIDGGSVNNESTFWEQVIDQMGGYLEVEAGYQDGTQFKLAGTASASIGVLSGKFDGESAISEQTSTILRRSTSNKSKALQALMQNEVALIVDDFHYIDKQTQKSIVRALKSPIMHGLPVIFIAIPNRKFDVVDVEREMTGRIETVEMPAWSSEELEEIARTGFEVLNVSTLDDEYVDAISAFVGECQESPFLMQEFCKELCIASTIDSSKKDLQHVSRVNANAIFGHVAENSGRAMFKKLERGPRQRTDRKDRKMKNGVVTDIYGVVMAAFQMLRPNTETITYDTLRAAIRQILVDDLPQHGEISRVLEKIAEISHTDSSSTPVIDWQKDDDLITITDPFFAFFLRWNQDEVDKRCE